MGMSNPVKVESWAGQFDCATCSRNRLMASSFSNKMMENHRKHEKPLKCKECVEAAAKEERDKAAAKAVKVKTSVSAVVVGEKTEGGNNACLEETVQCAACQQELPKAAFNATQLRNKGPGRQRCRACIDWADNKEKVENVAGIQMKIEGAKAALERAEASGTAAEKLKAATELCALQAESVTGIRPKVLGRGGGRGGRGGR